MEPVRRILLIETETRYGREAFKGVCAYARGRRRWDYQLCRDHSPEAVGRAGVTMKQWKPDGIIAHIRSRRVERLVKNSGLPVVNFSGGRVYNLPTVLADNITAGRVAARHFLERGFRHFAFAALTPEFYGQQRYRGYASELQDAGYECEAFTDFFGRTQMEKEWNRNRQRMKRWLLKIKKPVALFCIHDFRAHEAALSCQHLGLCVPDDVAILGADNDESLCLACTPQLSSMDFAMDRVGFEAARLLDRLMAGGKPPDKPMLVPPRGVVTRRSSDFVAVDDLEIGAAMRYIRDHASEPISVKDLLREVPISRRMLELRFSKAIGRTPKQEIMRVRMERAKALLGETSLAIPTVARDSGFASQSMFSTAFHREVRMTPTDFRRKRRLNG